MESLLSIITINYNNGPGLEKTIASVLNQSQRDFEFIVVDGGSKDTSAEVISKHNKEFTKVISEMDKGIYDAQNKGAALAKGNYLLFLNSGDTFYDRHVVASFFEFVKDEKNLIVYGNSALNTPGGTEEKLCPPATLDAFYFFKHGLNHQACFIANSLFKEFGPYELKYRICADFDFLLAVFCKKPGCYRYLNTVICHYDKSGASSASENYDTVVKERELILKRHLAPALYVGLKKRARAELSLKYRILTSLYALPLIGKGIKQIMIKLFPGDK